MGQLSRFEEEIEAHEYKAKVDEMFKRIEDNKKTRTYDNIKDLKNWLEDDVSNDNIDDMLEFLSDRGLLNDDGKMLRKEFWEKYIKK